MVEEEEEEEEKERFIPDEDPNETTADELMGTMEELKQEEGVTEAHIPELSPCRRD